MDYGLRYSLYPPVTDANNVLTSFLPSAYVAANAPKCANAACTLLTAGTGDPLNGIIVAGKSSPFGDAVYAFDKGDIQPRVGVTWDPKSSGRTIFRTLVPALTTIRPWWGSSSRTRSPTRPSSTPSSLLNTKLSTSSAVPATTGVLALIGNGDDFNTPRTQQWNVGVQQQALFAGSGRRQLRRFGGRPPDPPDRHQLPAPGRRCAPAASTWRVPTKGTGRSRSADDHDALATTGGSSRASNTTAAPPAR